MINPRKSNFFKISKSLQSIFNLLELPLGGKIKEPKVIFIIGIPRSGTTIAYQLISNHFKVEAFRNIDNYFYKNFCFTKRFVPFESTQTFSSHKGYVKGLFGLSECSHIFKYWLNNPLYETSNKLIDSYSVKKFKKRLGFLSSSKPLVFSYIGNVLIIDDLLRIFDNCMIIRLDRDRNDLLASLIKCHKEEEEEGFFSIKPKNWESFKSKTPDQKAKFQHQSLSEILYHSKSNRIIDINYEDLCNKTEDVMESIQKKAETLGIKLMLSNKIHPKIKFKTYK